MNIYGLYDMKYYEQCVFVGTSFECAKYMNLKNYNDIFCYINRGTRFKRRFEVKKVIGVNE